jgi:two-component system, NarL family, response regulator NreC
MHSSATTIILADDHRIVRQGLHALLKAESDFDVIGEADDGLEALELVKNLNPDVAVLDLMMPGLNGLETARQINKQYPQTKTVILSMYDDEGFVLEALSNGVSAYVLKDAGSAELIRAVRDVRNGHRYLSSPLADRTIEVYEQMTKAAGTMDKYETLTPREREVLQLCAEGRPNSEIASQLGISAGTAKTHRSNIMNKLGIDTEANLTRYAIKRGLVPME